jgi:hypothetical protein
MAPLTTASTQQPLEVEVEEVALARALQQPHPAVPPLPPRRLEMGEATVVIRMVVIRTEDEDEVDEDADPNRGAMIDLHSH